MMMRDSLNKKIEPDHDFHLIIDEDRKSKLKQFLFLIKDVRTVPGLISFLLKYLYLFIETNHFAGSMMNSQYILINQDKVIKRNSIHVFIPKSLYNRIKLIHKDLDFYSMAQIVRGVVDVFIILAQELGDGFCDYIDKKQKEWDKIILKYRKSKKPIRKRQMSEINRTWRGERERIELKTMYNNHFLPIEIQLE